MFEPDLVLFTCDCIYSDYGCCNVSVANERQQLVYNTGTNGYIQLPAGNYTVECVSLNTSRVVSEKNVMLLEGKINVSPTSVCTTTGSISLSDIITSSINRKLHISWEGDLSIIFVAFISCCSYEHRHLC